MNSSKLMLLKFLVAIFTQGRVDLDVVEYYMGFVVTAMGNGLTYEWPVDSYQHFSNTPRKKYGTYDFVIIGAGAGGSVAANRLTENPDWKVLVLEAGNWGSIITDIPYMFNPVQFSEYNWAFNSTPQDTACLGFENRVCLYPRGKGVGGSSLINALIYARGHDTDYDNWAQYLGDQRWAYANVLKYFKKDEHFVSRDFFAPVDQEYHGTGGESRVEHHKPRSQHLNAFLRANMKLGFDIVDYNANKLGAAPVQLNTINGVRMDNGKAFLMPVVQRPNLQVLTGSYVTRLVMGEGPRVVGVEFTYRGRNYYVEANYEYILSAGVFGSAQILMQSGIGPAQHLSSLGIPLVANLPVGSTLFDHPMFIGLTFISDMTEQPQSLFSYVLQYFKGIGPYTIPGNQQAVGFYESSYTRGTGIPEIELLLVPPNATNILTQRSFGLTDQSYEDTFKYIDVTRTFVIYIVCSHPRSSGSVRLRSNDPFQFPLIDSAFLSDEEGRDIEVMYEGIQLAIKLAEEMGARVQGGPLRACAVFPYMSRDYWYCALRQLTANLYHPVGSNPMGAVVDSELRVFGVEGLRVADASVIPILMAGHPNAATLMIGEQLADMLKETYTM